MVDWGGSSEGCLRWGGRGSFQNILKQGVGKGKSVCRGFEGVIAPSPPPPPHPLRGKF